MSRTYRQLAFSIEAPPAPASPGDSDDLAAFFAAWDADKADAMSDDEYGEWLNARPWEQFLAMMTWCFQKQAEEKAQGAPA